MVVIVEDPFLRTKFEKCKAFVILRNYNMHTYYIKIEYLVMIN
jgi:hypothetical protein